MCNLRILLMLVFLFAGLLLHAQNPFQENTYWSTSQRIDDAFEDITFNPLDTNDFSRTNYYRIRFMPNNQFVAYNLPGCGLDCIVQAYGTFASTDTTTQFTINRIARYKRCSGVDTLSKNIGNYYIVRDAYSLRLVSSLADEPKHNYFEKHANQLPRIDEAYAVALLQQYAYLYNRIYQIVANKNYKKYEMVKREAIHWASVDAKKYNKENPDMQFYNKINELLANLEALYKQIEPK